MTEPTTETFDLELIRRARQDPEDRRALSALMAELLPKVRGTVRWLVGSRGTEAEDIVGSCMVEILSGLHRYRGEGPFVVWAQRLTYRVTMRTIKRHRRRERAMTFDQDLDQLRANGDLEAELLRGQLRERLQQCLELMDPKRRAALVLRVIHGYSVDEVAEITRARRNTVRGRIRAALKELRTTLGQDLRWLELVGRVQHG